MQNRPVLFGAALVAAVALSSNTRAQFASSVISYNAGTGAASGYNTPSSALGQPSTFTVHEFGGPVDPFNPPFLPGQIVSLGTGGSLTLQLDAPVSNDSWHTFGMDFVIYGNSGFQFNDFGAGTTDGSQFGEAALGSTRVSVSVDNVTFYTLQASLAPVVDRLFPTDGSGLFGKPANPALVGSDFNGKNLAGIRSLYDGSAGGASYDIGWARDASGNPVSLDLINYIRIDVLTGAAEIDSVVATPEPTTMALFALGIAAVCARKKRA